jgi:hypothetical protein
VAFEERLMQVQRRAEGDDLKRGVGGKAAYLKVVSAAKVVPVKSASASKWVALNHARSWKVVLRQ